MNENDIRKFHRDLLEICLKHRAKNPGFTFYLRDRPKEKLAQGRFFSTNEQSTYIYTSPYKFYAKNGYVQRISFGLDRSFKPAENGGVGLFVTMGDIEVNEKEIQYKDFFRAVIEEILNQAYDETLEHYFYSDILLPLNGFNVNGNEWKECLQKFLEETVPKINDLAREHDIEDEDLFFSESVFTKRLDGIQQNIATSDW